MNTFNPKKLLNSKWTAVKPVNKERHFIVTELVKDEDTIIGCVLEAIINHHTYTMQLADLKASDDWQIGWK